MNALYTAGIQLVYLGAATLFIMGLHWLRAPATASRGNGVAALGMLLAVGATLLHHSMVYYGMVVIGLAIGTAVGIASGRLVPMTAMPQMVGLLNGFGGGASALVALAEAMRFTGTSEGAGLEVTASTMLGILIGGITLTGSLVAFGKLQELLPGAAVVFPWQRLLYGALLLAILGNVLYGLCVSKHLSVLVLLGFFSLVAGVLLVLPIGAADMPVVIALLNAFSGLAASAAGFVVANDLLIIAGALVGASGVILTQIMCQAMNRSMANVLFGTFGRKPRDAGKGAVPEKVIHAIEVEEAAMMLAYAHSVVIVPGYGMAVAQAQHAVHDLSTLLAQRHIDVQYAIHPVAGRMPGHMNVLLAEANVPYEALRDLDDINPAFEHTDVVLVIGANDIVNPAAHDDPQSPIYGMPILEVARAQHVIVIKRSMSPGFAGIDNALFYHRRTLMLFGDARQVLNSLNNDIKRL